MFKIFTIAQDTNNIKESDQNQLSKYIIIQQEIGIEKLSLMYAFFENNSTNVVMKEAIIADKKNLVS